MYKGRAASMCGYKKIHKLCEFYKIFLNKPPKLQKIYRFLTSDSMRWFADT